MNPVEKLELKIERTSQQRRDNLLKRNPVRTKELDERNEELYAQLRTAKAQSNHGTRDQIIKQARVERELEKLGG